MAAMSPFARNAKFGAMLGLCITAIAIVLGFLDDYLSPPPVVRAPLKWLVTPVFLPAGAITYFGIVGDNIAKADFFRYVIPISAVINMILGAIGYTLYANWRRRRASETRGNLWIKDASEEIGSGSEHRM